MTTKVPRVGLIEYVDMGGRLRMGVVEKSIGPFRILRVITLGKDEFVVVDTEFAMPQMKGSTPSYGDAVSITEAIQSRRRAR